MGSQNTSFFLFFVFNTRLEYNPCQSTELLFGVFENILSPNLLQDHNSKFIKSVVGPLNLLAMLYLADPLAVPWADWQTSFLLGI